MSPVISPPATAGGMEFYQGPAPAHLTVSGVQITPPDTRPWPELDGGGLFLKAHSTSRPHITNCEGAHAVDPLPRGWDDQGWYDPGAGRQRPEHRRSYDQTLADLRAARRDAEKSHGSRSESGMSRVAKIVVAKPAFKRHHARRTLAKKLTSKNHPVSKSAIHRYRKTCLQLKPLKLKPQPS